VHETGYLKQITFLLNQYSLEPLFEKVASLFILFVVIFGVIGVYIVHDPGNGKLLGRLDEQMAFGWRKGQRIQFEIIKILVFEEEGKIAVFIAIVPEKV
jgi:hypothetical protein